MKARTFHILFFIAIVVVILSAMLESTTLPLLYAGMLFIYSVKDMRLGLSTLLLALPITGAMEGAYLNLIFTSIVLLVYIIKIINGKERLIKSKYNVYFFLIALIALLSTLLTGYTEYLHVWLILLMTLLVAVMIIQQTIRDNDYIYQIINSIILSGAIATIASFFLEQQTYGRLAMGDNIRSLSNLIGISLISLISFFFFIKELKKDSVYYRLYNFINSIKYLLIIILVIGLISTMSRGVFFTVGICIIILLLSVFTNVKKYNLSLLVKGFIIFNVLYFGVFNHINKILDLLNLSFGKLEERLGENAVISGTSSRFEIWSAGMSALEGGQVFFGHGMSSFRMLANKNGVDFYSHSVFIDVISTTGIVGFSLLLLIYLSMIIEVIKQKNVILFIMLIYSVINYISHGDITSYGFWLVLSLSISISLLNAKRILR